VGSTRAADRRKITLLSAVIVAVALIAGVAVRVSTNLASAKAAPTVVRDVKTGRSRLPALTRPVPRSTDPTDGYSQPDTQVEPSIDVNPANPRNAVAVYQEGRFADGGDYTNGFATTFDAGKTWTYGELPKLTINGRQGGPFERASDPVVAFGPHNVVYANSLVIDISGDNGLRSGLAVNTSKDGGRHWSAPIFIQDDNLGGTNDKNWIVVDNSSAPGHHLGRVYVIWDRVAPVVYDYCDHDCDKLSNWLPNLQKLPGLVFAGQGIGSYPLVLKDGGLGIVINTITGGIPNAEEEEQIAGELNIIIAPNAGSTPYPLPLVFTPPIDINGEKSGGVRAQRAGGLPAAAVDPSSGTIYAVWEDNRFRSTGTLNDALISRSTNGGITWTKPTRINRDPTDSEINHYNPTVAVGAGGRVHVAWRERDESGGGPLDEPFIDTFYAESYNGGKTFTKPLRVNHVSSDMSYGAFSRGGAFEGDYNQVASAGGITYIVRCQAAPAYKGEPAALVPDPADRNAVKLGRRGHQHQSAWVAVVQDLPKKR